MDGGEQREGDGDDERAAEDHPFGFEFIDQRADEGRKNADEKKDDGTACVGLGEGPAVGAGERPVNRGPAEQAERECHGEDDERRE